MRRFLGYLIAVALLTGLAFWLGDEAGTAHIVWRGWIIETSAVFLVLLILAVAFLLHTTFRLVHVLRHGPRVRRLERRLRHMQEGHHHMGMALTALADGDAHHARQHARAARKKIGMTPVTQFLESHISMDESAEHAHAGNLLMQAAQAAVEGDIGTALGLAKQAHRSARDWLPAIIAVARYRVKAGHRRRAQRFIEKYWPANAHPELAAIYGAMAPSTLDRVRRIERLCRADPDSALSLMLRAEAAMEAGLWGAARQHLKSLVARDEATQGAYRLFARLEQREHAHAVAAAAWMAKAVEATPDPVWLCQSCGGGHEQWQTTCRHCQQNLTLVWQSPGISRIKSLVALPVPLRRVNRS